MTLIKLYKLVDYVRTFFIRLFIGAIVWIVIAMVILGFVVLLAFIVETFKGWMVAFVMLVYIIAFYNTGSKIYSFYQRLKVLDESAHKN